MKRPLRNSNYWAVEYSSYCVKKTCLRYWRACSSDGVNSYVVIAKMRTAANDKMVRSFMKFTLLNVLYDENCLCLIKLFYIINAVL